MRLDLVCKKKNRGSIIIGDSEEVMSLWHQIKIGAIMFSIILILSALVYPAVPRFNNLSLTWVPSTLLGLPDKIPLLKLLQFANKTIKNAKVKEERRVNEDDIKKRETAASMIKKKMHREKGEGEPLINKKSEVVTKVDEKEPPPSKKEKKEEKTERFKASDFNRNIDALKVVLLAIDVDRNKVPLNERTSIVAKVKLVDGSMIFATKLVDWKVTGTAKIVIDRNGNIIPKEEGHVRITATYMGVFSNDVNMEITRPIKPIKPKKKRGVLFYLIMLLLWLLALALAIFLIRVFIRLRKLSKMFKNSPKEFIKEVYSALCGAFKIYGIPKFDHVAYREFYDIARELVSAKPGPMQALTEEFLEARFSSHVIYAQNSRKTIQLFREVKKVVLEKEGKNKLWKGLLFRMYVFDISLVRIA